MHPVQKQKIENGLREEEDREENVAILYILSSQKFATASSRYVKMVFDLDSPDH